MKLSKNCFTYKTKYEIYLVKTKIPRGLGKTSGVVLLNKKNFTLFQNVFLQFLYQFYFYRFIGLTFEKIRTYVKI